MRKPPILVEGPEGYNLMCKYIRDEDCFGLVMVLNILAFSNNYPIKPALSGVRWQSSAELS